MNEFIKTDSCILTLDEKSFTKLLLYGGDRYDSKTSKCIILVMKEKKYLLALFRFQCLSHYIDEPDNDVSS